MSSGWQNVGVEFFTTVNLHTIFQCKNLSTQVLLTVCCKYREHHSTENLKLNKSPNESVSALYAFEISNFQEEKNEQKS